MLDYVKRSELEAERALRIRAEAEATFLRGENTRLLDALDSQRRGHAEQVERILAHIAPLQPTFDGSGPANNGSPKSPLELLADAYSEAAIGQAAIDAKRNKIARLEKMIGDSAVRVPADDNGDLSAQEEARISEKVGA